MAGKHTAEAAADGRTPTAAALVLDRAAQARAVGARSGRLDSRRGTTPENGPLESGRRKSSYPGGRPAAERVRSKGRHIPVGERRAAERGRAPAKRVRRAAGSARAGPGGGRHRGPLEVREDRAGAGNGSTTPTVCAWPRPRPPRIPGTTAHRPRARRKYRKAPTDPGAQEQALGVDGRRKEEQRGGGNSAEQATPRGLRERPPVRLGPSPGRARRLERGNEPGRRETMAGPRR